MIITFDTEAMTVTHVSQVLGLSYTQVRKHIVEHGLPSVDVGEKKRIYILEDVLAWYVKYRAGSSQEDLDELDKAKLKKLQYQAEREKLRFLEESKSLLPAEQIDLALGHLLQNVNTLRENLGEACSLLIYDGQTKEERAELIQQQVDAIFTRLADATVLEALYKIQAEDLEELPDGSEE